MCECAPCTECVGFAHVIIITTTTAAEKNEERKCNKEMDLPMNSHHSSVCPAVSMVWQHGRVRGTHKIRTPLEAHFHAEQGQQ